MIKIDEAFKYSRCVCCNSDNDVKDVIFCNEFSQSMGVILCRDCRKTLITKLMDELSEIKENSLIKTTMRISVDSFGLVKDVDRSGPCIKESQ